VAERLSEEIYQDIRCQIIDGILPINVFLTEGQVAAKYGVSKAPVREALHLLCQEGYLVSYPRKGYMVSNVTPEQYEQIREVRAHVEQLSIVLAVQRASDEEIISLRDTISEESTSLNPYKTNNTRFHSRLAEIAHNPYIGDILHKLLGLTSRYAINQRNNNVFHERIIEALLERNKRKALKYLDQDLNLDRTGYWLKS